MSLTEQRVTVYECPYCGRFDTEEMTCCGDRMAPLESDAVFQEPRLEQVAKQVFAISANELAVCKVVMAEGPTTVADLADRFDYDRSTVSRHLGHLVELGLVEKDTEELPGGGRKYVYSTVPAEEVRRTFVLGLYAWTEEAFQLTEELSQGKLEAMVEDAAVTGDGRGEETTDGGRATAGRDRTEPTGRSLIQRLFNRDRD